MYTEDIQRIHLSLKDFKLYNKHKKVDKFNRDFESEKVCRHKDLNPHLPSRFRSLRARMVRAKLVASTMGGLAVAAIATV